MSKLAKTFDLANIIVITVTFILFFAALVAKGLTHDILLETAVFLVSVKLILATYKNRLLIERIEGKIDDLHDSILHDLNRKE
ncbi:MAG: hypothetical protein K940chlam7_01855 [Chlamydiae bacterium]|nr:hypothetical protein [Chlamydiota bacterium]